MIIIHYTNVLHSSRMGQKEILYQDNEMTKFIILTALPFPSRNILECKKAFHFSVLKTYGLFSSN